MLSTLKIEATSSSETSVLTGPTLLHISEKDTLHYHRREDVKFNIACFQALPPPTPVMNMQI
jgi:hypothetical protein